MTTISVSLYSESGDDYCYLFEGVNSPAHLVNLVDSVIPEEWQYLHVRHVVILGVSDNLEYVQALHENTQALQQKIEEGRNLEDGFYD